MTQSLKIALLCGGPSLERGISLNSARSVLDHLAARDIEIVPVYFDEKEQVYHLSTSQLYSNTPADFDFKLQQTAKALTPEALIHLLKQVDIAFPAMHGRFGEDGTIQQWLEQHGIPFVGTGSAACRQAFDKFIANETIAKQGFFTLPSMVISSDISTHTDNNNHAINDNDHNNDKRAHAGNVDDDARIATELDDCTTSRLGGMADDHEVLITAFFKKHALERAIVKPASGGSSIGVFSVSTPAEALAKAHLLFSKHRDKRVVIEPFAEGIEFTTILLQNHDDAPCALIPTEIETDYTEHQIFDFRKKYLPSRQVTYHCPPRFDDDVIEAIQAQAEQLFTLFGMRDFARFDGWVLPGNHLWFSDFNPISGMEQNSFLFMQAARIGMSHSEVLRYLVKHACGRYGIAFSEANDLHHPLNNTSSTQREPMPTTAPAKVFDDAITSNERRDAGKTNNENVTPNTSNSPAEHKTNNPPAGCKAINILLGGKNAERQISLMSGTNVWLKLRNTETYQPQLYLLAPDSKTLAPQGEALPLQGKAPTPNSKTLAPQGEALPLQGKAPTPNSKALALKGEEPTSESEASTPDSEASTLQSEATKNRLLPTSQSEALASEGQGLTPDSQIWHVPYPLALNHTVEDVIAGCEHHKATSQRLDRFEKKARQRLALTDSIDANDFFAPQKISLLTLVKQSDFIFIALHGGEGENGDLQKLLSEHGVAFNGSGEQTSKLCMNKWETSQAVNALDISGVRATPGVQMQTQAALAESHSSKAPDPQRQTQPLLAQSPSDIQRTWQSLCEQLQSRTLIVKPVADGCSTGIVQLRDSQALTIYLDHLKHRQPCIPSHTFEGQDHIIDMPPTLPEALLFETFIETDKLCVNNNTLEHEHRSGWIEVTVGVIEQQGELHVLQPSVTVSTGAILTVEEKFQGGTGINLTPPPPSLLPAPCLARARQSIAAVAAGVGIRGYARIDAFINIETGDLMIIEINTLPALTPSTVLYHQALAEASPIYPRALLVHLIESGESN